MPGSCKHVCMLKDCSYICASDINNIFEHIFNNIGFEFKSEFVSKVGHLGKVFGLNRSLQNRIKNDKNVEPKTKFAPKLKELAFFYNLNQKEITRHKRC